jgi:hypothetical protein
MRFKAPYLRQLRLDLEQLLHHQAQAGIRRVIGGRLPGARATMNSKGDADASQAPGEGRTRKQD